ncbi:hypothetical protein AWB78_06408 [Caballeronia calidae]|uniref:Uncharacterized protein n=1 Tax=Caballeronia calidae TaxID=1777139 RepID=A0A158E772_9BURK|nr:hypothetical protein AWB78_06408 [Caballeronia calidae]
MMSPAPGIQAREKKRERVPNPEPVDFTLQIELALRQRYFTICASSPDLYFSAILSREIGLILPAMPSQPNCM